MFLVCSLLLQGPLNAAGKVTVVDKLECGKMHVVSRSGGKLPGRKLMSETRSLSGSQKGEGTS